ncbi:TraB domain-containing protein [Halalkalirubrum salinum]|uniref:TraB domain-containing protein n=1 Tax=Halalkalirubrum salinum TaxID=2563889 RepID=UPI0010FB4F45|nr:TraB domain-containing protein [Halalkalirubrum salinum]
MAGTVELIGTTHNTDQSIERVETVIRDREPDVVGIELPPHVFDDEPEWSIRTALDPREPVTVPGLLLKRRTTDGGIWQVDEMFVAARVAADVGAEVVLLDRPFAVSMDEFSRAVAGDVLGWLRGLRQEYTIHRDRIDANDRRELLERDVWKVGEWASPYVEYIRSLQSHGATNPLDAEQREAAKKRFGPEDAEAAIDVIRAWLPRLMETHIDQRDAYMAGHLRWLATEEDDVLGIVAKGHLAGVAERLSGERELDERLVRQPAFADPKNVSEAPLDSE